MTDANHAAATLMESGHLGGFAQAIGTAYFRADSRNQEALLLAFADLFRRAAMVADLQKTEA